MSTLGVAHHQRGTFPTIDTAAECEARKARYAARDAAYRAALRLNPDEPLPGSIGQVSGGGRALRRGKFLDMSTGGRLRLRAEPA